MRRFLLPLGLVILGILAFSSLRPEPASAAVHISEIHEVMAGFNGIAKEAGDPNVQYVEINMRSIGMNITAGSKLGAFDAAGNPIDGDTSMMGDQPLLTMSGNVTNSGDGVRWLIGTTQFEMASGIQADFELPATPGLPLGAGMVCLFESFANHTMPSQSIDCVAYGGAAFTGSNPNSSPSEAATSGPGDCQRSLTRIGPATFNFTPPWALSDDATDFALATPSPENNAGQMGSLVATDTDSDTQADCRDNDDDNDTVKDAVDNCPTTAGLDQTDNDSDGAGVPCDPDDAVVDFDQDGCWDGREVRRNFESGGLRDPADVWDFYDTPDSANMRNQVVGLFDDIFGVAGRFGASGTPGDPLAGPIPAAPAYHTAFDRGAQTGAHQWNVAPADGNIDLFIDIFGVAGQFGHDCTGGAP
ncbi:MAG: flexitail domain-containing putative surface protein [Dehalococcoidia bacterium]|nr:flexitail domain-containing putative surface protein [Dehalococcoidia bacterium]